MNKSEQRKNIKNKIKQLSIEQCENYSQIIINKLNNIIEQLYFERIMSYQPFSNEVNISAFNSKYNCYFPVINDNDLIIKKGEQFKLNIYGIKEPVGNDICKESDIDVVIVPLIGFDEKGNRLGRGKGYYDRFLKKTKALKIAVGYECQKVDNLIYDENDVKMDMIITEKKIYGRNINEIKKGFERK